MDICPNAFPSNPRSPRRPRTFSTLSGALLSVLSCLSLMGCDGSVSEPGADSEDPRGCVGDDCIPGPDDPPVG
ncbi:MAG: hypothetical protein AAGF12_27065, partial [Myxococcota bacterium]